MAVLCVFFSGILPKAKVNFKHIPVTKDTLASEVIEKALHKHGAQVGWEQRVSAHSGNCCNKENWRWKVNFTGQFQFYAKMHFEVYIIYSNTLCFNFQY